MLATFHGQNKKKRNISSNTSILPQTGFTNHFFFNNTLSRHQWIHEQNSGYNDYGTFSNGAITRGNIAQGIQFKGEWLDTIIGLIHNNSNSTGYSNTSYQQINFRIHLKVNHTSEIFVGSSYVSGQYSLNSTLITNVSNNRYGESSIIWQIRVNPQEYVEVVRNGSVIWTFGIDDAAQTAYYGDNNLYITDAWNPSPWYDFQWVDSVGNLLGEPWTTETLTLVQMPTTDPSDAPYHRTGIIVSTGTTLQASGGSFDPWATAYISNWAMTPNSGTHSFTAYPRDHGDMFMGITNYNTTTGIIDLWNHTSIRAWYFPGRRPGIGTNYSYTYNTSDIIKIEVNMDAQNPLITFYKNNVSQFTTSFNGGTTLYPYVSIYGNGSKMTLTRN